MRARALGVFVAIRLMLHLSAVVAIPGALSAQPMYEVVASSAHGSPVSGVIQGSDGRIYGTTYNGGTFDAGTIFAVDATNTLITLHEFSEHDGRFIFTGLIEARDGQIYGIAQGGGASDKGTVFKFDRTTGTVTTIHNFSGGVDGDYPIGELAQASDGRIYGTTRGGMNGKGTIFSLDTVGIFTTLHSFKGVDGSVPHAALAEMSDGNLYGTTLFGGLADKGVAFRFDPSGTVTMMHSFSGSDGANPSGGLIEAADGKFYSTTYTGGAFDQGTVYALNGENTLTTLHSFSGKVDGSYLSGGLIQASDGYFYGATCHGGKRSSGTLFRIDAAGVLTTLHHFNGIDGECPRRSALIQATDGRLYGTASLGGGFGYGVVFRLSMYDLLALSVSDPPSVSAPGGAFSVTDTTRNDGMVAVDVSTTRFYLSTDNVKSLDDHVLLGGRVIHSLGAGASSTGTVTIRVPTTVPSGTYWLLACADAGRDVEEISESNNCRGSEAQVTVAMPDLRQVAVSTTMAYVSPGAKLTVSDTVENPSLVDVIKTTTRYYLSIDTIRNAGDVLLGGKRAIPGLAPGAFSSGNATVTVTTSMPAGAHYVLACADDLLKVKESNESNNCAASASTVLVGWADLVTTTVSDPPATAPAGGKFTLSDTVLNQGTLPAAESVTRYYLSADGIRSSGDVLLAGNRKVVFLYAGDSDSGSRRVTVPLTTPGGTYYVLACADDTNKVPESDNANNCRASIGTVLVTVP